MQGPVVLNERGTPRQPSRGRAAVGSTARAGASAQERAPGVVEDAVVELVDRDRARQAGQLETLAAAIDVGLIVPLAALGAAVDLHAARVLGHENVRLE